MYNINPDVQIDMLYLAIGVGGIQEDYVAKCHVSNIR